jgi:hypothetical protein
MKLATLADPVKAAYRQGAIDTATAEAFASVPPDRQLEVWQEVGGNPQHAQHVRNVIAHAWIDAGAAIFDVSKVPDAAVSRDLFAERVLIERKAFMEAQADALLVQRQALIEEGWSDVVIGPQADVQDRLWAMGEAPEEYDAPTSAKLQKLAEKRKKLESQLEQLADEDEAAEGLQTKLEALDMEQEKLIDAAEVQFSEATKAIGTAFLLLDPDGQVRKEFRIPRSRPLTSGNLSSNKAYTVGQTLPKLPTPDDLKEPQLATTFTHQALGVRAALLENEPVRKCILAMILHDKVRSEALAISHEANAVTLHANPAEGFNSAVLDDLRQCRTELDPLHDLRYVEESAAYAALKELSPERLDALIDLLTVECITAHLQRRTTLVWQLSKELGVQVRRYWRPDERWLSSYQKIQLAHLIGDRHGRAQDPVHRLDGPGDSPGGQGPRTPGWADGVRSVCRRRQSGPDRQRSPEQG